MPVTLVFIAVVSALLSAAVGIVAPRFPLLARRSGFGLLAISGIAALAGGGSVLIGGGVFTEQLPFGLPWLPWRVRLDPLSGFFLALIGIVTSLVAAYGPGYARRLGEPRRAAPLFLCTGLFVAGMMGVTLADDAFLFMVAWEVMSLSSYFLVAFHHEHAANRRAAFLYLLMAHVGGLAILLGYGVLAAFGGGFSFDAMRAAELSPVWASVAFALVFLGFGMKAGLVPLHAWLPEAHPVAPSHISALMSGVMLKVAVYGFVRVVFDLIGDAQAAWGVIAIIVGCASALIGVLYALVQNDIKRLLAWSSVENVGIVFIGLGLALVFLARDHAVPGTLAFIAALYHALNHAVFKSLLFLGVGAVIQHTHEHDLDRMGGLMRRMPYTGFFMLVGCLSIAGLPPLNGFASEWLTFQAALQGRVLEDGLLRILIPVAAAALALAAALSAACFVRLFGVAFLGQPRTRHARGARMADPGMRVAQGTLAFLCLVFGLLPTLVVAALDAIPVMLFGDGLPAGSGAGWMWLTPLGTETASYAAPLVLVGLGATAVLYLVLNRGPRPRVRVAPRWDCGFPRLTTRMQYTATAFAQPSRRIFSPLWRVEEQVQQGEGGDARHTLLLRERLTAAIYEPLAVGVLRAARLVTRLQAGSMRLYLSFSFFTLIFLLWLIS